MQKPEIGQKPAWKLLGLSKNGVRVVYDPVGSHAATHFEDTPQLEGLVREIVADMELDGREIGTHVAMGRVVGTCDVVMVRAGDEIVYGMRKNRADDGLVPFVKNRSGEPCSDVAVHLAPQDDGTYVLWSAWIGTFDDDEPFPGSPKANERSVAYWNTYAFVYGSQEIVAGTETSLCPW